MCRSLSFAWGRQLAATSTQLQKKNSSARQHSTDAILNKMKSRLINKSCEATTQHSPSDAFSNLWTWRNWTLKKVPDKYIKLRMHIYVCFFCIFFVCHQSYQLISKICSAVQRQHKLCGSALWALGHLVTLPVWYCGK